MQMKRNRKSETSIGPRLRIACGCALAVVVGLSACAGGARETIVASVGSKTITRAALLHWTTLMASGRVASGRILRQRALELLVLSDWLIQEAGEERVAPSAQEIKRRVEQSRASGATAFPEFVDGAPRTGADLELEAAVALAAARLRQIALTSIHAVSAPEVARYYARHRRAFLIPERRYFDIDNLRSDAAARKARREVESGRSFAGMALHEQLSSVLGDNPGRHAIERAIFAAEPNVLGGPVLLADVGDHSIFEVRRIIRAHYEPLAQVKGSIASRLTAERQRQALAEFAKSLRAKWGARTDCYPGYVVPTCRQYAGPQAAPQALLGLG
jgi:hypothetical protein